jgi:predicted alpha/beta-hydrolase family hydrolase
MTKTVARDVNGVSCLFDTPSDPSSRLVLAHGAGAPMDSPFMETIARLLYEQGIEVVRFEFPYMARRRQTGTKAPPNRQPVLLDTWRQLISELAKEDRLPLYIGGKSMGGRMATLLAVEEVAGEKAAAKEEALPIKGVVCLGYPFHPRGKPEKLRTEHSVQLNVPTLIVQGSRDPMGSREEVSEYTLSTATVVAWLDTANHDLKPLRKSGFSHDDYLLQAAERVAAFIRLAS